MEKRKQLKNEKLRIFLKTQNHLHRCILKVINHFFILSFDKNNEI